MPVRKKASASRKKKSTKKKVARKTAARKKSSTKKKATARKTTRRKAVAKKKTKKKVAKKATKRTAKKTARKKATAKKTARKKTAKKVAKKPAARKKKVAKKTAKKAAAKKTAARKTTKKRRVAKVTPIRRRSREAALLAPSEVQPYKTRRGESFMNDRQRDHFRQILSSWKMELMQEVDRTMHHMKDEAANFPDPNDRATQESEFSLELRTRDRERKLIKKIDEAILTVDSGDYGYCESCGIEIGVRRLEARPTATQCIDCKTLDEIREKQMGG